MSWNDQNNNGSRDPWGNKNDAPDIDEAIKRFKAIFGPIFGGGSGGGGGKKMSSSKYISYFFEVFCVILFFFKFKDLTIESNTSKRWLRKYNTSRT